MQEKGNKSVIKRLVRFLISPLRKKPREETTPIQQKELPIFLPPRREEKRKGQLNIGIDFGTSSTKVFLKDILSNRTYVYAFDNPHDNFGPFCWPSTIRIADRCLYFGIPAERKEDGKAIRSFKICFACKNGTISEKECLFKQCETNRSTTGIFTLLVNQGEHIEFNVCELTALFVAQLLDEVLRTVRADKNFDVESKYTVNMTAPLDMLNNPDLEISFNTALHLANLMTGQITQGIPAAEAKEKLYNARLEFELKGLPTEDIRSTFLVPETHAAMMGYMVQGRAEPGLYAAVDVGAGTTDVAIFRRCDKYAERDFTYYFAGTDLVGGDDIDRNILKQVVNTNDVTTMNISKLLGDIRHIKLDFDEIEGTTLEGQPLKAHQFYSAMRPVLDRIVSHYQKIWGGGYEKEKRPPRWQNLSVLLLGGCTKMPLIQNELSRCNPAEDFIHIIPNIKTVELPEAIEVLGSSDKLQIAEYANLLMVAYGASFHIGEIKSFFPPRDVGPDVIQRPPEPEGPFWGHWW